MILAGRYPRRLWWRLPVLACLLLDTLLTGSLAAITGLLAGLALALIVRTAARHGGAAALALFLVLAVAAAAVSGWSTTTRWCRRRRAARTSCCATPSAGPSRASGNARYSPTRPCVCWRTSTLVGLGPNATKSTLKAQRRPTRRKRTTTGRRRWWNAASSDSPVCSCWSPRSSAGVPGRISPASRAGPRHRAARS